MPPLGQSGVQPERMAYAGGAALGLFSKPVETALAACSALNKPALP
jgi:hypothetical protein